MSINNKTPPKGAGGRSTPGGPTPKSAASTTAKTAPKKSAPTQAAEKGSSEPWPDAFETDPQLNQHLSPHVDDSGASGVRQSGVRQMSKVLQKTLKNVRHDIAELGEEQSALLAELVASGFSDEVMGAGGDKRKARRDKLNALRRREISLRRRLKTMGCETALRDPVASDDVNALAAKIEDRAGKNNSAKDQTMDVLRDAGAPNAILRLAVKAGERNAAHALAVAEVLPGVTSSAWLAGLLSDGPTLSSGDVGPPLSPDADVRQRYQQRARLLGQAA